MGQRSVLNGEIRSAFAGKQAIYKRKVIKYALKRRTNFTLLSNYGRPQQMGKYQVSKGRTG